MILIQVGGSMKYLFGFFLTFLAMTVNAQTVTVSIVTDWNTVYFYGSPQATRDAFNARMEGVKKIYKDQLKFDIIVSLIDIPSNSANDKIAVDTNADALILKMTDFRTRSTQHKQYNLTMLLTTRDLVINKAGIAQKNSVCTDSAAGIAEVGGNEWADSLLIAHEMGHILGADHDGETGSSCATAPYNTIMTYLAWSISSDQFSQCSMDRIKTKHAELCTKPVEIAPVTPSTSAQSSTSQSGGGGGSFDPLFFVCFIPFLLFGRRKKL
jgi:hypothetical protein